MAEIVSLSVTPYITISMYMSMVISVGVII